MSPRIRPTRERILRAAVLLFQRQGYHGTGVAQILERARAPKGCFYHHFPEGKEELAVVAVEWLRGEVEDFLRELRAAGTGGREMALDMAAKAAEGLARREQMRGSLITILAQETVPRSRAITAALSATVESWQDLLASGFETDGSREPRLCAQAALGAIEGAITLARITGRSDAVVLLVSAALDRTC